MTFKKTATKVAAGILAASVCFCGTVFADEAGFYDVYADDYSEVIEEQYAFTNVSEGSLDDWSLYVQQLLYIIGFPVDMDGYFGATSVQYLKQFQSMRGIYPDGIAGPITLRALEESAFGAATTPTWETEPAPVQEAAPAPVQVAAPAPVQEAAPEPVAVVPVYDNSILVRGDSNDQVWALQQTLINLGYLNISAPDGIFGNMTENAVKAFQSASGIVADGAVGPTTKRALYGEQAAAPAAPAAVPAAETVPAPAVQPVVDTNLARGTSNDQVVALQQRLIELNYLNISAPDGIFGQLTENAVKAFQSANGIVADGVVGPTTNAALYNEATAAATEAAPAQVQVQANENLTTGSTGSNVIELQQALNALGYSVGADGIFGQTTANAVTSYQRANGIYADGVAGPTTMSSLRTAMAIQSGNTESLASAKLQEFGNDLYTAFEYCANATYSSVYVDFPPATAAYNLFVNNAGNCMNKAAAFYYLAKQLGYDVRLVSGTVKFDETTNAEHAWTEITVDGATYVCDPNFEWDTALVGNRQSGFMRTYGSSGTWLYQFGEYLG